MTATEAVHASAPTSPLHTIRPERAGIWTAALGRSLAFGAPICITILVLASNHHTIPLIATMLGAAILSAVLTRMAARSRIDLIKEGFIEHGLTGSRAVSADRIASVVLVPVYDGTGLSLQPQLFALDADGRTVLRMRGRYWSATQMTQVATHFDAPVERVTEPLTIAELRRTRGPQLYWFERHPLVTVYLSIAAGAVGIGAIIALAQYALS